MHAERLDFSICESARIIFGVSRADSWISGTCDSSRIQITSANKRTNRLASMSATPFALIEAGRPVANCSHSSARPGPGIMRTDNEAAYQPDEHRRASRPTARLLRSCSIARANVHCTISFPSTHRSCTSRVTCTMIHHRDVQVASSTRVNFMTPVGLKLARYMHLEKIYVLFFIFSPLLNLRIEAA